MDTRHGTPQARQLLKHVADGDDPKQDEIDERTEVSVADLSDRYLTKGLTTLRDPRAFCRLHWDRLRGKLCFGHRHRLRPAHETVKLARGLRARMHEDLLRKSSSIASLGVG